MLDAIVGEPLHESRDRDRRRLAARAVRASLGAVGRRRGKGRCRQQQRQDRAPPNVGHQGWTWDGR